MQQDLLIAGDTLNFLTSVPDYPASAGWVLKFYLVRRTASGSPIVLTATAEGDDHRVTVTAATTAGWSPDNYSWSTRVEKGAEKYTVHGLTGQLVIQQDPATAANGFDGRSVAEKALADANAAMAAWTVTKRRYRIGDREVEFSSKADIVGVINHWEIQVKRERRQQALAEGRPDPAKTYVRINRE
jgi:hypothetical protein